MLAETADIGTGLSQAPTQGFGGWLHRFDRIGIVIASKSTCFRAVSRVIEFGFLEDLMETIPALNALHV